MDTEVVKRMRFAPGDRAHACKLTAQVDGERELAALGYYDEHRRCAQCARAARICLLGRVGEISLRSRYVPTVRQPYQHLGMRDISS
jgi:hypothetical protein